MAVPLSDFDRSCLIDTPASLKSGIISANSMGDETVLRAAVRKCLDEERIGPIYGLGFSDCGPYVGDCCEAKSSHITIIWNLGFGLQSLSLSFS